MRRKTPVFGLLQNGAPIALSLLPPIPNKRKFHDGLALENTAVKLLSQPGSFHNGGFLTLPMPPPPTTPGVGKGKLFLGMSTTLFQTLPPLPSSIPPIIIGGVLGDQRHVWKHDFGRRMK